MFATDPWPMMLAGLAAGLVFGVLLQKGGVSTYRVIVGQFLLADHTVAKTMLTAIVVGSVGIYGMATLGWVDLAIKPSYLAGVGLGGLIFGVGMSALGYCPGTAVAAVGQGSRHAIFGVLGGLFGAGIYGEAYPFLEPNLLKVWDLGKVTLPQLLGVHPFALILPLAVAAVALFTAIGRWERRHPEFS